jgi:hypothetical protein
MAELGQNEQGFLAGAMAGAGTGASIGFSVGGPKGALGGAAIGFFAGGLMGASQSQSMRSTQRKAQKEAQAARRRSIMQEMGARQQAENIAMGGMIRNTGRQPQIGVMPNQSFIGQNLSTTAGTF